MSAEEHTPRTPQQIASQILATQLDVNGKNPNDTLEDQLQHYSNATGYIAAAKEVGMNLEPTAQAVYSAAKQISTLTHALRALRDNNDAASHLSANERRAISNAGNLLKLIQAHEVEMGGQAHDESTAQDPNEIKLAQKIRRALNPDWEPWKGELPQYHGLKHAPEHQEKMSRHYAHGARVIENTVLPLSEALAKALRLPFDKPRGRQQG